MDEHQKHLADRRLTWLALAILIWTVAILAKILSLQVVHHQDYLRVARQQQEHVVDIPAPRGTIFDRTGQLLAISVPMDSVFINPLKVPDLKVASEILSSILDLDRAELYGRMRWALQHHKGFLWVKRKIGMEESERLRSLHLEWIEFETDSQRHYPAGSLAAQVLGSVDHEETGNWGIEKSLDKELRGQDGSAVMLTDVKHRGIDSRLDTQPQPGASLTLTIDERIQFVAEQALAESVEAHHAKTGSVVVMNPNTGDILAMASYPAFDPNTPPTKAEDPGARINHAISAPFEPGSVFKVVTLSAALETTGLRPDSPINCGRGAITIAGRTVHEAHGGYGVIPMSDVLARSSNVGAIQIGLRVGQQNLREYARRFGVGSKSGIQLPAESRGMLRKLSRWGPTSLPSVAMGHEVSVTTLQLAQICSIVANGGLLVHPRIVLKRGDRTNPPAAPQRAIRPETAITMRSMMEGVVVLPYGTGHRFTRLAGYSSGGKTGSAQIFDFATRHYTHDYNASFMGFAPVINPAIVVVATVNGTHGSAGFGASAAGPVFKVVATEALRVLDVPKDIPEDLPPTQVAENDPGDGSDLAISELADPDAVEEEATEDAVNVAASVIPEPVGPRVPDFKGKSMRDVVAQASSLGLPVLLHGSGVARVQEPGPGAVLREGERVRVQFAR